MCDLFVVANLVKTLIRHMKCRVVVYCSSASCFFYLQMTDVEAGGATVFPEIGLRLVPEKVCICFTFEIYLFI